MILTIYTTGLIVCLIYDISMHLAGENPHEGLKKWQIILDEIAWPITIIAAMTLAIILHGLNKKERT